MAQAQRRRYMRVPVCLDVEYQEVSNQQPAAKTKTIDVSGGGIKAIFPEQKKIGTFLNLTIQLSGPEDLVHAQGIVAWIGEQKSPSGKPIYEAGIQFTQIDLESRQKVISFVYDVLRDKQYG